MNEYYYGTSAYKLEEYEIHAKKTEEKKQERKKVSKAEQLSLCRWMVAGIFFIFAAASALVYLNVMTIRASTDIDNLEKQLAAVIDENRQKEIKINQKLDMKVIEKKAVEELGMQKPDNSQIIYVDVKKPNHVEVNAGGRKTNVFANGVKFIFNGIVEYFR